jgi:5'-methylthioadenosine phosphorylase
MENTPILAIIGGSGLYTISGLEDKREYELDTPFGKTSAPIVAGKMDGQQVVFLARHGIGHFISPSEVNYRANIYALKSLGVDRIVSISACGSLRDDYAPGNIVVPDGLFDFTRNRTVSFFEQGLVAHISVPASFCPCPQRRNFHHNRRAALLNAGRVQHLPLLGDVHHWNDRFSRSLPGA